MLSQSKANSTHYYGYNGLGRPYTPTTLNKYLYVDASPTMYTDPSGHMSLGGMLSGMQGHMSLITRSTVSYTTAFSRTFIGLAQQVGINAIKHEIKRCVKSRGKKCRIRVPIVVIGQSHPNQLQHVLDAQLGNGENFGGRAITPLLTYKRSSKNRNWPTRSRTSPRGMANSCNLANDLIKAKANFGGRVACDEYPFSSSKQGGYKNYRRFRVSLRYIPNSENTSFGFGVLGRLRAKEGDKYLVAPLMFSPVSFVIPGSNKRK